MENDNNIIVNEGPRRKLSVWRILIALVVLAGFAYSGIFGWQWWQDAQAAAKEKPWFASYVDVTATPIYPFEQLGSTKVHNIVLSFIVSSSTNSCAPTWGNYYTLNDASSKLDLDRRIARLEQQNGSVSVSFGGQLNNELAVDCKDPNKLLNAYQQVIDRYNLNTIDLDLENSGLTDQEALKRRAIVLAKLQSEMRSKGKSLAIWLTLPVSPQGLTPDGITAVSQMLSHDVDLAGVNVMTMDYGNSRAKSQTMAEASEEALNETHRQLGILYQDAGISLGSETLWSKIGATPMIGQNDVTKDIFTIDDAVNLNKFATNQGVGRMSMWSANRDIQCGANYTDIEVVSDSCSGVKQDNFGFALALSNMFNGNLIDNSTIITTADADANIQVPDDPAKSPYQIWQENGAYLEGTKVVWHHNVYQAKWWTEGDIPDNPVLQSWQTPWQLIGPVLPGEKPIPQPTLPRGTYPNWSGDAEYDAGDRILFNEVPYQAKWWTKGDSPAAASSTPDNSPWIPLTQAEVAKIINQIKAGKPITANSAAVQNTYLE
jgi:chitinase